MALQPQRFSFPHIREDKKNETKPLTISHGHSADLSLQEKFRFEFDWQGTRDPTAILCIPKSIETLNSMVSGGFDEIMERNNSLALKARKSSLREFRHRPSNTRFDDICNGYNRPTRDIFRRCRHYGRSPTQQTA